MHNLVLMTGNLSSYSIQLLVLEISAKDANLLRDAHQMAGAMADRTENVAASAAMSITRMNGARAFHSLPEKIAHYVEESDVEALHAWVSSDESLSYETDIEQNRISVMSNIHGSMSVFIKEKFGEEVNAVETLPLTDISNELFWEAHAIGDILGVLPESWMGIVTRSDDVTETLKEFEIEVVRTSYSKPKTISVMAKNRSEANRMALEEAHNHEFRENSSSYQLIKPTK